MSRTTVIAAVVALAVAAALSSIFDVSFWQAAVAFAAIAVVMRIGWAMIAGLAQPPQQPPDPGQLRKVKLTYSCSICGAEVRMTVAASEDPEPPRHCLEDMVLLTPVE